MTPYRKAPHMTAIISGGCIRLYSTGPEWHINPEHSTIGLLDHSEQPTIDDSGYLVVKFTGDPTLRAVVSMTAASDETLTSLGISAGCSNGGPICRMRFYKAGVGVLDLRNPAHWAYVDGAYNNIWLTAIHETIAPAA